VTVMGARSVRESECSAHDRVVDIDNASTQFLTLCACDRRFDISVNYNYSFLSFTIILVRTKIERNNQFNIAYRPIDANNFPPLNCQHS